MVLSSALYCPNDEFFYKIERYINSNAESLITTHWSEFYDPLAKEYLPTEAVVYNNILDIFKTIQDSLRAAFAAREEAVYDEPSRHAAMLDFITQKKNELLTKLYLKPNWNT